MEKLKAEGRIDYTVLKAMISKCFNNSTLIKSHLENLGLNFLMKVRWKKTKKIHCLRFLRLSKKLDMICIQIDTIHLNKVTALRTYAFNVHEARA